MYQGWLLLGVSRVAHWCATLFDSATVVNSYGHPVISGGHLSIVLPLSNMHNCIQCDFQFLSYQEVYCFGEQMGSFIKKVFKADCQPNLRK